MSGYRYGEYHDGPDPLAPPFDARGALDELGDAVLDGADPSSALRDLLRRGVNGRRGLDDLLRRVREQQQEIRSRGRLDGILEQARALLDTAIGQERAELFPDPSDEARLREDELDALPSDTAQAIRRLADYNWRSPAARQTFEQLKDLLRSEVLDSQFRGMKDVLQQPDPEAMQRVKDMLADLNPMLERDARGEHTQADFDAFMDRYGDMFPEQPAEPRGAGRLAGPPGHRGAAAARLADRGAARRAGRADGAGAAGRRAGRGDVPAVRLAARPAAGAGHDGQWPGDPMTGDEPLGLSDATTALADLADLADLEAELRQDYPGARLDDIDEAAIRRALGRQAVDDMEALRRTERELERQGYLQRNAGQLELTPKAVRRLGETALRRVFADLPEGGYGDHEQRDAGQAGEYTGATRRWQFGDEQAIDAPATVRNALLRDAAASAAPGEDPDHWEGHAAAGPAVRPRTSRSARRSGAPSAAVCLLVDLSYSMALRGTWGAAKQTALALHALVRSRFPQDSIQVIGFSNYARELRETDLAGLGWDMVQGTNLHHALVLAGRYLDRRPEHDPVVLIVTDGEPTAHLRRDGQSWFDWPPAPETIQLTLAEVDKMTRRHASLNVFMLAEDERLTDFVNEVARRNGGRVLRAVPERLGEFVVRDFLRTRRESRR